MKIIEPLFCESIFFAASFVQRNAPAAFVSSTERKSRSGMRARNESFVMPALFTRTSILPVSAKIFSKADSIAAPSDWSQQTAVAPVSAASLSAASAPLL